MDATRISDGKYVILKMLPEDEGPDELQLNRLFSSEHLASNPRNHCAPLLDVIQLPNDPPIMVHSQLRLYYDPPFHTYGEFVAFFGQMCEVRRSFSPLVSLPCSIVQGIQFMHENHVAHRYLLLSTMLSMFLIRSSGTAHHKTSCLTHHGCIRNHFIPWKSGVLGTFVKRRRDIRGLGVGHGTFSLTLAFLGNTIRQMGHL
jgi:hypothetical protein